MRRIETATPLGALTLVADGDALVGAYFAGARYRPADLGAPAAGDALLARAADQVRGWFAGERRHFDLPLAPVGPAFHHRVWDLLLAIPAGGTTTYGALAAALGDPRAAQAVGQAVGHNPIAVIIPCHRVLGADGSLTGYAGGLERKRWLLDHESPAGARLF